MTSWILRPASRSDAQALGACMRDAYSTYEARLPDLPAVAEGIADDIENHLVWVAESEKRIIAGVVLIAYADHAVLANIAVESRSAGLGLGRALIQLVQAECRARGLYELRLSTHVGIPENVSLYQRLGWHETGRIGNKVHMTKTLNSSAVSP